MPDNCCQVATFCGCLPVFRLFADQTGRTRPLILLRNVRCGLLLRQIVSTKSSKQVAASHQISLSCGYLGGMEGGQRCPQPLFHHSVAMKTPAIASNPPQHLWRAQALPPAQRHYSARRYECQVLNSEPETHKKQKAISRRRFSSQLRANRRVVQSSTPGVWPLPRVYSQTR